METKNKKLTLAVKALLKKNGKTTKQFAEYLGINQASMGNKLSRGNVTIDDLIKLCDFLGAEIAITESDGSKTVLKLDSPDESK